MDPTRFGLVWCGDVARRAEKRKVKLENELNWTSHDYERESSRSREKEKRGRDRERDGKMSSERDIERYRRRDRDGDHYNRERERNRDYYRERSERRERGNSNRDDDYPRSCDYDRRRDYNMDGEDMHRHIFQSRSEDRSEPSCSRSKMVSGFDMAPPTSAMLPSTTGFCFLVYERG